MAPGQYTLMRSVATGMFCGLAGPAQAQVVYCNIASASEATPFQYQPGGLVHDNRSLVTSETSSVLTLNGAAEAAAGCSSGSGPEGLCRPTPVLFPGTDIQLTFPSLGTGSSAAVASVDPATQQVLAAAAVDGTGAAAALTVWSAAGSSATAAVRPCQNVVLSSKQSGLYCRLQQPAAQQVTCDMVDYSQATPFKFTGSTLQYNCSSLGAAAIGQPLQPLQQGSSQGVAAGVLQAGAPLQPLVLYTIRNGTGAGALTAGNTSAFITMDLTPAAASAARTARSDASAAAAAPRAVAYSLDEKWFVFLSDASKGVWSTAPITAGSKVFLSSAATGALCRASAISIGFYGIRCDANETGSATQFLYTGSGLSLAGTSLLLATAAQQQPMLWTMFAAAANSSVQPAAVQAPLLVAGLAYSLLLPANDGLVAIRPAAAGSAAVADAASTAPGASHTIALLHAASPTSAAPITADTSVILRSTGTGKYARLQVRTTRKSARGPPAGRPRAPLLAASQAHFSTANGSATSSLAYSSALATGWLRQYLRSMPHAPMTGTPLASAYGLVFDAATPAQASPLLFTGLGLALQGLPLVLLPETVPMLTFNRPRSAASASYGLQFVLPGNALPTGVSLVLGDRSSGYMTVTSTAAWVSFSSCPARGFLQSQRFMLVLPGQQQPQLGSTVKPGGSVLLFALGTGRFCRLVPLQPTALALLCDTSQAAAASVLTYTSSGLLYNFTMLLASKDRKAVVDPAAPLPMAAVPITIMTQVRAPPPRNTRSSSKSPPPPRRPNQVTGKGSPPLRRRNVVPPSPVQKLVGAGPPVALRRPPSGQRATPTVPGPPPATGAVIMPLPRQSPGRALPAEPALPCNSTKVLQVGSVCGGINLCGKDGVCNSSGCCIKRAPCTKLSAFTWACVAV